MSLDRAREAPAEKGLNPQTVVALSWEGEDVLYRLVRNDPPQVRDLTSTAVKGLPPVRQNSSSFLLLTGISMFDEDRLARGRARAPTFLAEVHLREGLGFYVAKTVSDGHFTVWGDPSALTSVTRVVDHIL
jgi:hypothetical protein